MKRKPANGRILSDSGEESRTTWQRILLAAKSEFAERGLRGSRIGSIAKRAGVNQALVHYYFKSKEKLYESVLRHLFGVTEFNSLQTFISNYTLSPSQELFLMLYYMSYGTRSTYDPERELIMIREYLDHESRFIPLVRGFVLPWLEKIETIIKKGVDAGEFSTPDATLSTVHIISFFHSYDSIMREIFDGTKFHGRLYGRKNRKEIFEYVVGSAFKSLAPGGRAPAAIPVPDDVLALLDKLIAETLESRKIDNLPE